MVAVKEGMVGLCIETQEALLGRELKGIINKKPMLTMVSPKMTPPACMGPKNGIRGKTWLPKPKTSAMAQKPAIT